MIKCLLTEFRSGWTGKYLVVAVAVAVRAVELLFAESWDLLRKHRNMRRDSPLNAKLQMTEVQILT